MAVHLGLESGRADVPRDCSEVSRLLLGLRFELRSVVISSDSKPGTWNSRLSFD